MSSSPISSLNETACPYLRQVSGMFSCQIIRQLHSELLDNHDQLLIKPACPLLSRSKWHVQLACHQTVRYRAPCNVCTFFHHSVSPEVVWRDTLMPAWYLHRGAL